MKDLLSCFSCPVCGELLTEPAPPCPQCELMESAKARGIDIGPWPPNNPPQVKTCIAPQANIDPPREDGFIQSIEDLENLYNLAWATYGTPDGKEAVYHKVALAAWELDKRKGLSKEKGDYPGWIRLKYEHNYLDKRLIDWENGGPDPFMDLAGEGNSLEEVIESLSPVFEFIDFWWEKEPFVLYILENRVNQRVEGLISDSIEIPKNQRTSLAYYNLLNKSFKQQSQLFEGEITNGLLANVQWGNIYLSEVDQLLIENDAFSDTKGKNGYFFTISEAQGKDFSSIFNLISWDRTWLTCPWIQDTITKYGYDNKFNQKLAGACRGKPGCLKKEIKELIQVKKDSQFIYDRFFCGKGLGTKEIYKFINEVNSFTDTYQGSYRDPEEFRKFLIRNLRK